MLSTLARALGAPEIGGPCDDASALIDVFPTESLRALAHALIVCAVAEGDLAPESAAWLRDAARVWRVESPWISILGALQRGDVRPVKRCLYTRSPDARRILSRTWSEEGLGGIGRALLFALGRFEDPALAARFRALDRLPGGSFGRAVFEHLSRRGLSFPGEKGGVPERMFHHDLMHVLNDFDTDARGECEIGAFYAASARGDAFTYLMTAVATFQLGLRVSPEAVTPAVGAFDYDRMIAAYLRGRQLNTDVMGPWDYWSLFALPLDEVRARLGLEAPAGDGGPRLA